MAAPEQEVHEHAAGQDQEGPDHHSHHQHHVHSPPLAHRRPPRALQAVGGRAAAPLEAEEAGVQGHLGGPHAAVRRLHQGADHVRQALHALQPRPAHAQPLSGSWPRLGMCSPLGRLGRGVSLLGSAGLLGLRDAWGELFASRLPGCLLGDDAREARCRAHHPQPTARGLCCCGSMGTLLMSGNVAPALIPQPVHHTARRGGGGQSCSLWPDAAAVHSGHPTRCEAVPILSAQ